MKTIKLTPKQLETVTKNIQKDKETVENINKLSCSSIESFIENALRYINAINQNRMFCIIESVSQSGMSRNLKFHSFEIYAKKESRYNHSGYYSSYFTLFVAMGFTQVKSSNCFKVNGCGMDMVFYTNYSIIHKLHNLGFIDKKMCEDLAQKTPSRF